MHEPQRAWPALAGFITLTLLTEAGQAFLDNLLPPQYNCLLSLWSTLNEAEKQQLESLPASF